MSYKAAYMLPFWHLRPENLKIPILSLRSVSVTAETSLFLRIHRNQFNLFMALSNNDVFKKLRVALKLRDDDIVHICSLVDFKVTKSEIGAIFRSEDHPKYMECGDQFLRNFLNGLVIYKRGPMPKKNETKNKETRKKE